jgi:hypothetical protein
VRPRLASAFLAAFAAGLLAAWPAGAEEEGPRDDLVEVDLISPSTGTYSGIVTLYGTASSPAGIKRAELLVDNYVVAVEEPKDYRKDVELAFDWDTRFVPGLEEWLRNGRYQARIRAVPNGERSIGEEAVTIVVDNAPVPPEGLRTDVSEAAVSLTWAPNPEPDILHYVVQRDSGSGYVSVAKRKSPDFYEIAPAGGHAYRVFAVRRSPAIDSGQTSLPSRAVGVTISEDAASGAGVNGDEGAPGGLPSGGLPDFGFASGLPPLPGGDLSSSDRWGGFGARLPYGKMKVPKEFRLTGKDTKDTRDRWWNVIPPDGLRWVAAGVLLLVLSAQARLFAKRMTPA